MNVDPAYPPLNTDIKAEETHVNPGEKKTLTREERRQKKIAAMEKKRQRRDERKYSKTRRSKDGTWAEKGSI